MADPLARLVDGGKSALAQALAQMEVGPESPAVISLLDQAWAGMKAHVIGLTGPPGVGKSSLLAALLPIWRGAGKTVGVIAVDPSSRRTGGALLGDRARLKTDPEDQGVFVRSMAARDRLGGLGPQTLAAHVLMSALFDIVVIETVGVGQSETEIAHLADTIIFCIQPGSGDAIQFMKAGIVEVPHICVVTKADMGAAANRAVMDASGAFSLSEEVHAGWHVPVSAISSSTGVGLDELVATIARHRTYLCATRPANHAKLRTQYWMQDIIRERFGSEGLERALPLLNLEFSAQPFSRLAHISTALRREIHSS
jgi:LAO/AO transport system kinase